MTLVSASAGNGVFEGFRSVILVSGRTVLSGQSLGKRLKSFNDDMHAVADLIGCRPQDREGRERERQSGLRQCKRNIGGGMTPDFTVNIHGMLPIGEREFFVHNRRGTE